MCNEIENQIKDFTRFEDAIQGKEKLTIFVGNGISRLSGAPSWNSFFSGKALKKEFFSNNIDIEDALIKGISLPEIADILDTNNQPIYGTINDTIKRKLESLSINLVHKILLNSFNDSNFITTNYDKLLEKADHGRKVNITHLHGTLEGDLIQRYSQYRNPTIKKKIEKEIKKALLDKGCLLFIGYGHHADDFNIINTIEEIDVIEKEGRIFSLVNSKEYNGILKSRFHRLGINAVKYNLQNNPTTDERIIALSGALKELKEAVGKKILPENESLLEEMTKNHKEQFKNAAICIGLVSKNTTIEPLFPGEEYNGKYMFQSADNEQVSLNRINLRAKFYEEIGGPACISSTILSQLGFHTFLVSTIGTDSIGSYIEKKIRSYENNHFHTTFLEKKKTGRSWESIVLIDDEKLKSKQRVFLDRFDGEDNLNNLGISQEISEDLITKIKEDQPKIVFFDKFHRNLINNLFGSNYIDYSRDTWFVYETGSNGDKFFKNTNKIRYPYFFEEEVICRKIDILTSSFAFACDFLCKHFYMNKVNSLKLNSEETELIDWLSDETSNIKERERIKELISSESKIERFCGIVMRSSNQWLRDGGQKTVIITLHEFGCLWIKNNDNRVSYSLIKQDSNEEMQYTNFAGDVFRGALMAGILHFRKSNKTLDDNALNAICSFANSASKIKIKSPTLKESLTAIKQEFMEWLEQDNHIA